MIALQLFGVSLVAHCYSFALQLFGAALQLFGACCFFLLCAMLQSLVLYGVLWQFSSFQLRCYFRFQLSLLTCLLAHLCICLRCHLWVLLWDFFPVGFIHRYCLVFQLFSLDICSVVSWFSILISFLVSLWFNHCGVVRIGNSLLGSRPS